MSWIAIFFFIVQHIPDLVSIIKAVIALIHSIPHDQREQARAEIGAAIKTGDKEAVRAVVNEWHHKCQPGSVGCPMDLVG